MQASYGTLRNAINQMVALSFNTPYESLQIATLAWLTRITVLTELAGPAMPHLTAVAGPAFQPSTSTHRGGGTR
jgi:hypothetical protein